MTIKGTDYSSHELRQLYFQEEEFAPPEVDEEGEDDVSDTYEDDECYLSLGDQEVGSE